MSTAGSKTERDRVSGRILAIGDIHGCHVALDALLSLVQPDGDDSLIVLGDSNNSVYLSSRNLKGSEVVTSSEISTYKIMNANNVVFVEGALEGLESNLNKK